MRGRKRGKLRGGGRTTVGIYLLAAALGAFKKRHPGLIISLEIGTRARVQEQVLLNELDLAVVGPAMKDPDLAIIPFVSDELVVVAPAGHRFAGRQGLALKDLQQEPFVMREPASGSRSELEKAARKAGAKLDVAMELGSNGAIKHAVESGLGLAVISRYACALELSGKRLVELDVRGFPIRRDWHIVHLRRRKLPTSVLAFIEFLKETSWLKRNGSRGHLRPPTDSPPATGRTGRTHRFAAEVRRRPGLDRDRHRSDAPCAFPSLPAGRDAASARASALLVGRRVLSAAVFGCGGGAARRHPAARGHGLDRARGKPTRARGRPPRAGGGAAFTPRRECSPGP